MDEVIEEPASSSITSPDEQLEAIRAMLVAGHRSIRLEPHTFVLWGLFGAFWLIVEAFFLNPTRLPNDWHRGILQEIWLAIAVALAVLTDLFITRRLRRQREESYPFIQRQIGKLGLLFVGFALLLDVGTWFFDWQPLIFVVWTVIVGLLLYSHGLFSEPFLTWVGLGTILLAIGSVPLEVPIGGARCLLVAACGVGLPALGILLRPLSRWPLAARLLTLCVWMAVVAGVGYVLYTTNVFLLAIDEV